MKPPRLRIGRILDHDGRLNPPFIWVATALSLLLHAAALLVWKMPLDMRLPRSSDGKTTSSPLRLRVLPLPSGQAQAPAIAQRAAPPARRPAPMPGPAPAPRLQAPVIALNAPAPVAPAVPATPAPAAPPAPPTPAPPAPSPPTPAAAPARPPAGDFSAALEARRRARGNTAQSGTPTPSATDDDKARRDSIVASNLGQDRAPSFGSDPRKQGGGVFQIQGETFDRAELIFYGWNKEIGRMSAQAIEVRKADNPDIRIAVVRKMIAIIRDQEKNDFIWDSRRLGRSLNLSARLEDNAGLEDVLMREFYEVRR